MTNENNDENGTLDYLENDWDRCPVCDRHECTCPAETDEATAPVQLDRIAEIKKQYADAPVARLQAIKNYLREQREAKRAANAPTATYAVNDKNGRRLIKARSYAEARQIARGGAR